MPILSVFLVSIALCASARAQSAVVARPEPPVEERLARWLAKEGPVRRKLAQAVARAHEAPVFEADPDLKDAVAAPEDTAPAPQDIIVADGQKRRALMEKLPGMATEPFFGCRALEKCAEAPSSFHIEEDHQLQQAVVGLLRPWMLLQAARGRNLRFKAVDDSSDRLMSVTLEGLPDASLTVSLTPLPSGGYDVRLGGPPDLAELYRRERGAVLAASSPASQS